MNYAKIRHYDIANGEGVRVSLFVSGCTHHCPGCFNQAEQDFDFGAPITGDVTASLISALKDPVVSGLSILGGDPMCQERTDLLYLGWLCRHVHVIGKTVWLWTGCTWEDVYECDAPSRDAAKIDLLEECDVVIDGPFIQELADPSLKWRGSSNQRIIDVKKTLTAGHVVLYEGG